MTSSTTDEAAEGEQAAPMVPLRRQYQQIKARFPDTILFFRLGDFYETFEQDAYIASDVLEIVLTGREMGKGQRVPMAGIPYHAAEGYIARLIAAGHKVAVCEQVGEVTKGRGLVERDVTQVITPGTVTEPSMLEATRNNYIVGIAPDGRRIGIAFADISTGEFSTTEVVAASPVEAQLAAGRELLRLNAAEIVVPGDLFDDGDAPASVWLPEAIASSKTDSWLWRLDRAEERLLAHFGVESLDGFGCAGKPAAIRAAGGLLQYLADNQMTGLKQIRTLTTYGVDGFMTLDAQTRRNLELIESTRGERKHSLLGVIDRTRTAMGARLLRKWIGQPLLDLDALLGRQEGVAWFHQMAGVRAELRNALKDVGDIERLANRALAGNATSRELAHLRSSLALLPDVASIVSGVPEIEVIPELADVHALLERAIVDEPAAMLGKANAIRPGFAPELDGHRGRAKEARDWIAALERTERDRTGIRSLKVGYNKVFGYYLEITTAALATAERDRSTAGQNASVLPEDYIPKQSLANATRYFTPQLKEYETIVLNAEDILNELESDVFRRVVAEVAGASSRLLDAARIIAELDVLSNLADVAIEQNYTRPELNETGAIDIVRGRHPVLESVLRAGEYVPNDAHLDCDGAQVIVLTGPNMAGKSSWLRQVALVVLMAQIGSFVPAERARIGLVDRIFTRIGAQDDIATGQSTFMVEMLETANILNHATGRSLVVLDEIGRGTSTYDGLAIARAVVEYLHNTPRLGCKTLFATHYHELTELAEILPRIRTYRMDVLEEGDRVIFLRQVVPGGADRSYGIHVAELAGIPKAIVRRAAEVLSDLETMARDGSDRGLRRAAMAAPIPDQLPQMQLTMFGEPSPVIEELKALDVESLSPIEAITKLYELKRKATNAEEG
ncbi:DNA mismatch repair protein MutS [soil metagenome]